MYGRDLRDELVPLFEAFRNILTGTKDPDLGNAAIKALVWSGHHLQVSFRILFHLRFHAFNVIHLQFQVCGFLLEWRPLFCVTLESKQLLCNYVGTRASEFAHKTILRTKMKRKVFA